MMDISFAVSASHEYIFYYIHDRPRELRFVAEI